MASTSFTMHHWSESNVFLHWNVFTPLNNKCLRCHLAWNNFLLCASVTVHQPPRNLSVLKTKKIWQYQSHTNSSSLTKVLDMSSLKRSSHYSQWQQSDLTLERLFKDIALWWKLNAYSSTYVGSLEDQCQCQHTLYFKRNVDTQVHFITFHPDFYSHGQQSQ